MAESMLHGGAVLLVLQLNTRLGYEESLGDQIYSHSHTAPPRPNNRR